MSYTSSIYIPLHMLEKIAGLMPNGNITRLTEYISFIIIYHIFLSGLHFAQTWMYNPPPTFIHQFAYNCPNPDV